MDTKVIFTMALGLRAQWEIADLQFNEEANRLDMAKLWKQKWVVHVKLPNREAWHALVYPFLANRDRHPHMEVATVSRRS